MILGSKAPKADRACTKRILELGTHEDAAIFEENQRIRMFLELRKMRSSGAIRKYHLKKIKKKGLLENKGPFFEKRIV